MVEKNCVKIKKPTMVIDDANILMDRHWFDHMKTHLDEIDKEMPIKEIYDSATYLTVEFKNAKTATMYRLKYGDKG